MARVLVSIVTRNESRDLEKLIPSLERQTFRDFTILATDNRSEDGTRATLASFRNECTVPFELHALRENLGYTGGHNGAVERAIVQGAEWILLLNSDVVLSPTYLEAIVAAASEPSVARAASFTGKICRAESEELSPTRVLDTVGLRMTRSGRHFDVGSSQDDRGQYERPAEIFGVSGCVAFYRVAALQDVKIATGFLDDDFFLYREDVDLAWRLRGRGWSARYVPGAVAWHRRRNLPERRPLMSALANLHSVKNRFLLRVNNAGTRHILATIWRTFPRDLLVLGGCLTIERTSLPGLRWLARNRIRLLQKRREIQARRTVTDAELLRWFSSDPDGGRISDGTGIRRS